MTWWDRHFTYWQTVRWIAIAAAVVALWWFVWGWSDPALVAGAVAVGTAGYYLFSPRERRQIEDSAELLAAVSEEPDRPR
jgi:hypothetical protein